MPGLSKQASDLIASCRTALRPNEADRDRIVGCLRAVLGEAALPVTAVAVSPTSLLGWNTLLAGAIACGIFGGALALGSHRWHSLSEAPARTSSPESAPVGAPSAQPAPSLSSTLALNGQSAARNQAPQQQADPLAQEVALLARATTALNAGRAREALAILAVHERRFPQGMLSIERRSAKAKALCWLGRSSEARVELSQLPPDSLAIAQRDSSCGQSESR